MVSTVAPLVDKNQNELVVRQDGNLGMIRADITRVRQMHQTKKGNQWYFGMKAHIGVDAESGLAHSLATTAANAADVTQACVLAW